MRCLIFGRQRHLHWSGNSDGPCGLRVKLPTSSPHIALHFLFQCWTSSEKIVEAHFTMPTFSVSVTLCTRSLSCADRKNSLLNLYKILYSIFCRMHLLQNTSVDRTACSSIPPPDGHRSAEEERFSILHPYNSLQRTVPGRSTLVSYVPDTLDLFSGVFIWSVEPSLPVRCILAIWKATVLLLVLRAFFWNTCITTGCGSEIVSLAQFYHWFNQKMLVWTLNTVYSAKFQRGQRFTIMKVFVADFLAL